MGCMLKMEEMSWRKYDKDRKINDKYLTIEIRQYNSSNSIIRENAMGFLTIISIEFIG